jgi:hypothetical protein
MSGSDISNGRIEVACHFGGPESYRLLLSDSARRHHLVDLTDDSLLLHDD